jgi:hypothetical protein
MEWVRQLYAAGAGRVRLVYFSAQQLSGRAKHDDYPGGKNAKLLREDAH